FAAVALRGVGLQQIPSSVCSFITAPGHTTFAPALIIVNARTPGEIYSRQYDMPFCIAHLIRT
ncbi:MAG: hypothetical protein KJO66_06660, partial [Gammaproteobacteria bacterium]|nr:hypothetical protein [Gammaproteobacteria bacterium]